MTITTARQHGAGSSRPSASWSTRHCPVHSITALTTGNFVPQIRSPARPLVSFLIRDFFENRAARQDQRSHASFVRGPEPSIPVYYKGLASGMRTCSGRMPIPINQAGMRRRAGKIPKSLKNSGGFGRRWLSRTRPMIRLWMVSCSHCVKRTGRVRRSWIARRSSSLNLLLLSGLASRLAAATASCTAIFIPTPPIGDIACRRVGRSARRRRGSEGRGAMQLRRVKAALRAHPPARRRTFVLILSSFNAVPVKYRRPGTGC